MRHVIPCLAIGLIVLGACKPVATAARAPGTTVRGNSPAPVGSLKPTVKPASAAPSPSALEPMTLLKGTLRVDANYAVSAGGANVISAGGANVVSAGGGNVVSAGGANVVSAGGANFRLAALAGVPIGTMLPAKGMGVVPVSLLTGEPVGAVAFTGDRGEYEVAVPERLEGQVVLVASVPGRSAEDAVLKDPRLHYAFLPSIVGEDRAGAIDEDTALVTRYVRIVFVTILEGLMVDAAADYQLGPDFTRWLGGGTGAIVEPMIQELVKAMVAAKTPQMTPEARRALARRLSDSLAAEVDWAAAMVDHRQPGWQGKPAEKAMTAFLDLMKQGREAAADKMTADPDFFTAQPWLIAANQGRPAGTAYAIRKPSDLNDFLVHAYIGPNEVSLTDQVGAVYAAIGVPVEQAQRLNAAQFGALSQIGLTLFSRPALKARLAETIREAGQ